jgi:hypothetical protein
MPLVGEVPAPPAKTRTPARSATPKKLADQKPVDTTKKEARVATLTGYSEILQAGLLMFGQFADAETLDLHGAPFLAAVADMGDHHEAFGASLDKADALGPYMALAVAAIPMVMQFMANHGRIDASKISFGGIVPPDQLMHRRQAKLMEAQAEMIRAERLAQEKAHRAQAELQQEIEAFQALKSQREPAGV